MFAKLTTAVAIFIGGPVRAFLALFAGCEGTNPFFGVLCGHNILPSLVAFTFVAWLVLACAATLAFSVYTKQ